MTAPARPSAVKAAAHSQTFRRCPEAAARVRHMVRTVLYTWHLPMLADEAVLVASELAANASEHARGAVFRFTVIRLSGSRVRLVCSDRSIRKPVHKTVPPGEERGRGLAVIAGFSDTWGVRTKRRGKRVWTELEVAQ
ncbi:ATP-binding protein [Streptomyces sp. NPDC021218]|uniref:ATP-binding protein n=1 Tax=Streptomyces sp. NPDC021218 TaxID=3365119 RepID=UPI0037A60515